MSTNTASPRCARKVSPSPPGVNAAAAIGGATIGAPAGGATRSVAAPLTANSERPVAPTSNTHSANCHGSVSPAHRHTCSARARRSGARSAAVVGRSGKVRSVNVPVSSPSA
jgi:hypothetical protein